MSRNQENSGIYNMSQEENTSYKIHSNNSPDDDFSSATLAGKNHHNQQKLKWILVREGDSLMKEG